MRCILAFLILLPLCGCSVNPAFVDRMDAPAKLLLPDLRKVYEGGALDYTKEQRERRLLLLTEWEKTIKEAKDSIK
jgi:hypothetical protein